MSFLPHHLHRLRLTMGTDDVEAVAGGGLGAGRLRSQSAPLQVVDVVGLHVDVLELDAGDGRGHGHRAVGNVGSELAVDGDAVDGARAVVVLHVELDTVGVDVDHEGLDDVGRLDGHVAGVDGVVVVAHGAHVGGEEAGSGILDDGGLQLPQGLGLGSGDLDGAVVVGHAQTHQSVGIGGGIALIGHGIELGTVLGVLGHNEVGVVDGGLGYALGLDAGSVLLGDLIEIGGIFVGIG